MLSWGSIHSTAQELSLICKNLIKMLEIIGFDPLGRPIYNLSPSMIKIKNIKEVGKGDRLFYELGFYFGGNWIKTGKFKEIMNTKEYIKGDKLLVKKEYLLHHNY